MRPSSLASRANRNGCAPSSRRCNATVSDAARSSSIPINWDWRWRTSSKLSPRPRLEKSKRRYPPQSRPVRRRQVNRGALPTHLPRIEVVIDVDDRHCPCCAGALHKIGEDVAERLDVIPLQFRVLVIRRPKHACRTCPGTVLQARIHWAWHARPYRRFPSCSEPFGGNSGGSVMTDVWRWPPPPGGWIGILRLSSAVLALVRRHLGK